MLSYLSILKDNAGASSGTPPAHQVATVMTTVVDTSSSNNFVNNFSGNPFWIPPNMSHSIFSTHLVDRKAYKSSNWIIDTRATNHMVHSMTQLTTITSIIQTYVSLPNGEQAMVTHIGTVRISSTLTLIDVLCVPSFSFDLIYVNQLIKAYFCYLIFLGKCCFIQDLAHWSMIGLGRESKGLYLLQNFPQHASFSALATPHSSSISSDLWHTHLGHPSFSKMLLLNKFVPFVSKNKSQCCDICHFAKQKKLTFPVSEHVSVSPFELVHCDLWGSFFTATNEGYRYFLTIVDDFSRCAWVFLL